MGRFLCVQALLLAIGTAVDWYLRAARNGSPAALYLLACQVRYGHILSMPDEWREQVVRSAIPFIPDVPVRDKSTVAALP